MDIEIKSTATQNIEINNFCIQSNNISIHSCSSQHPNCLAENVLLPDERVF